MHALLQILIFWAVAFLSLLLALLLLNIYSQIIESDFTLRKFWQEAVIAGIASLIEAASVWGVVTYAPAAGRALIIPALIVSLLYKISHLEDWNMYETVMLLFFQAAIAMAVYSIYSGHARTALVVLIMLGAFLAIYAFIVKSIGE